MTKNILSYLVRVDKMFLLTAQEKKCISKNFKKKHDWYITNCKHIFYLFVKSWIWFFYKKKIHQIWNQQTKNVLIKNQFQSARTKSMGLKKIVNKAAVTHKRKRKYALFKATAGNTWMYGLSIIMADPMYKNRNSHECSNAHLISCLHQFNNILWNCEFFFNPWQIKNIFVYIKTERTLAHEPWLECTVSLPDQPQQGKQNEPHKFLDLRFTFSDESCIRAKYMKTCSSDVWLMR